jgi:hypothetical protein
MSGLPERNQPAVPSAKVESGLPINNSVQRLLTEQMRQEMQRGEFLLRLNAEARFWQMMSEQSRIRRTRFPGHVVSTE